MKNRALAYMIVIFVFPFQYEQKAIISLAMILLAMIWIITPLLTFSVITVTTTSSPPSILISWVVILPLMPLMLIIGPMMLIPLLMTLSLVLTGLALYWHLGLNY